MKVYIGSDFQPRHYFGSNYGEISFQITSSYDQDAQNFFNATGINDTNLKDAVNTFVTQLKTTSSLWDKMIQILPLVADDTSSLSTQFSYNLKDTGSYQASFPNGVATSDLSGFQSVETGNSSTRVYCDTNLNPGTEFDTIRNAHASIYTTSPSSTTDSWDWGVYSGGGAIQYYSHIIAGRNLSGGNSQKLTGWAGQLPVAVTSTDISGSFVSTQAVGGGVSFRVNKTNIGTGAVTPTSRYGQGDAYLGCYHDRNNLIPAIVTNKKYQCLTVGTALTVSEQDELTDIIQRFQENIDTALGTSRAV